METPCKDGYYSWEKKSVIIEIIWKQLIGDWSHNVYRFRKGPLVFLFNDRDVELGISNR